MVEVIDPAMLPFIGAFIFVFALVFGLLGSIKRFDRTVNLIIAAVIAFFAVMFEPFVAAVQTVLPIAAIILVILFFFIVIKDIFKGEVQGADTLPVVVALALSLLLLGIFSPQIGFELPGLDPRNTVWLFGIIIIIFIFVAAYKHNPSSPSP